MILFYDDDTVAAEFTGPLIMLALSSFIVIWVFDYCIIPNSDPDGY